MKRRNVLQNKSKLKMLILLNYLLLLVLLLSSIMYTSLVKWLPWYDDTGGGFIVLLIILVPAFIILGIAVFILGRFFNVSKINKGFPFIALFGNTLPILIDVHLSNITFLIGTLINIILFFLVIKETIKTSISFKNSS